MLFSVIIPLYNRASLVDEVLNSVQSQTEDDYEVIAVDDGSSDDTWDRLRAHSLKPRCLKIENSGAAIARNEGVKLAKGKYLAFLDSDDLWFPWTLELYKSIIEAHEAPSAVTSKPVVFNDTKELVSPKPKPVEIETFPAYYDSCDAWRWHGVSSFVIKRETFEKIGGFTSSRMNAEDADLMMKLGIEPNFIHIVQPAPFAYRSHPGNLTGDHQLGLAGLTHLVESERNGHYPGGNAYRTQRRVILSRHLRPAIVNGFNHGRGKEVTPLFWKSFAWHLRLGRFRFLAFGLLKSIRVFLSKDL